MQTTAEAMHAGGSAAGSAFESWVFETSVNTLWGFQYIA